MPLPQAVGGQWVMVCGHCGETGPAVDTLQEVVAAWNVAHPDVGV